MKLLRDKHVKGLNFNDPSEQPCTTYLKGKQSRKPFHKSGKRARQLLELVHTNICGPMEVESIGESRYFMTIR